MAKIFQLELFIKEMSLWTLPQGSEDHDETLVEVTVFDMENVPINGYVFGKNSTMNRGQNFLFTLGGMPADNNKVFFNVFKKAYNREKNFLGNGNIPIDQIFGDLFSQIFKDATAAKTSQVLFQNNSQNLSAPIVGLQPNSQGVKQSPSQTKANAASNNPKNDPQVPNQTQNQAAKQSSIPAKQSLSKTKARTKANPQKDKQAPNQPQNEATKQGPSQTKGNPKKDSKTSAQDPNHGDANVASTNDPQDPKDAAKNDPQASIPAIKNLKAVNISATTQGSPTSGLSKDVYPIIGCDSKQWGTICILMRLTCFGQSNAHPILIHQNHKEIILQNTPKSATYKCVPLQRQSHGRNDLRKTKQGMNYNTATNMSSSSTSSSSTTTTNDPTSRTTAVKSHFRRPNAAKSKITSSTSSSGSSSSSSSATINPCPGPPGSPSEQYEEFTAEINGNALCVRVPKNVGTVKRIYDNPTSSKKMDSIQNTYPDRRKIPIIRGNRKYPAHYGTMSSLPSPRNSASYNSITENRICRSDDISCPSNVQIIRRNTDPARDVFLLNIGRDARNGKGIQLEMKTPKNPMNGSINNKQTTSVQTYEDEFVGGGKKGGKGGKKGGKKGKK
ncbi:uncharacterized protein DDB_G0271670-like [Bradysia coprophila]|uniref:uncharacterized protein DDB_G0271670-like n=1 Tax=Bradysia coprophila TaxID=38358 RepID=UPI00187DB0EB|nr:uncharacterized protein DDB_G0271670-like [Bradysia coprophila]